MAFWTPGHLQGVTGGEWLVQPAGLETELRGLSIDSRRVSPGQVFLAVRGERFDGHGFLREAVGAGASLLIVDRGAGLAQWAAACGIGVLLVRDTLGALQRMASAYRDALRARGTAVIAVTGSNGKTSTRHIIHSVLTCPGGGDAGSTRPGSQSPKSYNNHIGVPLTLLATRPDDRFVVVELGMNQPGEIDALARITRPDAAVITHIGTAHLGSMGSRRAIAAEKASLLPWVRPGGLAVIPGDEPLLDDHGRGLADKAAVVRFGEGEHNDPRLVHVDRQEGLNVLTVRSRGGLAEGGGCQQGDGGGRTDTKVTADVRFVLPLPGRHQAMNALAVIAVARWMGMDDTSIARAMEAVRGVPMRTQVSRVGEPGCPLVLINDAYNANPDSVAAALAVLMDYPLPGGDGVGDDSGDRSGQEKDEGGEGREGRECGIIPREASGGGGVSGGVSGGRRRVVILGDMLELGPEGPAWHRRLGRMVAQAGRNPDGPPRDIEPEGGLNGGIDLVILVGPLMRHAAAEHRKLQPSVPVYGFDRWCDSLVTTVAGLVRPGDVVLLKASRAMGLERLVEPIQRAVNSPACRS